MLRRRAFFRALPVGARLVLSVGTLARVFSGAFEPLRQAGLVERIRAEGDWGDEEELARRVSACMVRCFLNVTSVLQCMDGFACVAVSCIRVGAEDAGTTIRNLYVGPQHLRLPANEQEWEAAAHHVFV